MAMLDNDKVSNHSWTTLPESSYSLKCSICCLSFQSVDRPKRKVENQYVGFMESPLLPWSRERGVIMSDIILLGEVE